MTSQSRNLPAALQPKVATERKHDPAPPAVPAEPEKPEPIVFFLAVPDKRFLAALKKCRAFTRDSDRRPFEIRIFHEPGLPNVPTDTLQLIGALSDYGTLIDQDGIDVLLTIKPENL